MPKRTNAFQKLILRIYQQLNSPGGRVEESVLLSERGGGTPREVDILLHSRVFGIDLRIAVECRGRKHKDDIIWIDGLIGKYRDLGIDKVVAVSKSGFSQGAIDKAAASGIETFTLRKALETDWPTQFKRLGVAQLTRQDHPVSISLTTTPAAPLSLTAGTLVFAASGLPIGTVEGMGKAIYQHRITDINRTVTEQALGLFKTLDDLKVKRLLIEMTQRPTSACYVVGTDGTTRLNIESVTVQIMCAFAVELANVSHFVLGPAQITTATIGTPDRPFSLMAVQTSDRPNQVAFSITEVTPSENAKKTQSK